jgi:RHS repeat-associated protein
MPVTNYIWDEVNDTLLAETDEAGNTIAEYTHEPGQFGGLISERRANQSRYYHYDGLGSTRQLTDATGQVTDSYLYDASGNTMQSTGTSRVPYHFVGRSGYYHDQELAEYYVRARHYSPALARWLSQDPIGYKGEDVNLYRYAGGSPITDVDPSGMLPILDNIIQEAERRRGHGPWEDSAQHCWAACYISVAFGPLWGNLAASIESAEELLSRSGDWARDILANHIGALAGTVGQGAFLCPSWYCDKVCLTYP